MGAKTPAPSTTTGWVEPTRGIGGQTRVFRDNTVLRTHYFGTANTAYDIDDGDTYASPYGERVVDYAFRVTSAGTVSVSESAGTFTFGASAANQTGYLYVWLSRN